MSKLLNLKSYNLNPNQGFTLIELLIVIVVMGIIMALVTTNLYGARQRASDSQKKSNLRQLQTALHLYYTNFHRYPNASGNNGFNFYACGVSGNDKCTGTFTAGGAEYLARLPMTPSGQNDFRYYPCNSGDDFRLKVSLQVTSDVEILESQSRCPAATCLGKSLSFGSSDYVLCGN